MKKTKSVLTIFILFSIFTNIKGQQKFEFMTISYNSIPQSREILISINGKEFLKQEVKLEKKDIDHCNTNPLLSAVVEYQDKGWEVMNFITVKSAGQSLGYNHLAYLRKKKE